MIPVIHILIEYCSLKHKKLEDRFCLEIALIALKFWNSFSFTTQKQVFLNW